jgi:hypothetical protein
MKSRARSKIVSVPATPVFAGMAAGSAFDDLAKWRTDLNLGARGTVAADGKTYLLARLDIDGVEPIYGINWEMGHPRPPGVTFQFLRHAEGDALSQGAAASVLRGATGTLSVEMDPCVPRAWLIFWDC